MRNRKIILSALGLFLMVLLSAVTIWRLGLLDRYLAALPSIEGFHRQEKDMSGDQHENHRGHREHGDHEQDVEHGDHDEHAEDPEHAEHHSGEEHGEHAEEHGEHVASGEHDEHDGHRAHQDVMVARFSEEQIKACGIKLAAAGRGALKAEKRFSGEVRVNGDSLAHVLPLIPGVVEEVFKSLGDAVYAGEVMAVIDSRELAEAKATYLAAGERVVLAQAKFSRERKLWEKRITSEQEYLDAKQALAEARIELRSAEQNLHAIGFSHDYLKALPNHPDETLTRYEITAPIDGVVVEKHCTLGEKVGDETNVFTVADLSTVWVDLSIYQKDLPFVKEGQEVTISDDFDIPDANGKISYVAPLIKDDTRTALARVVLPNPEGYWRPGLFVTAKLAVGGDLLPLLITKSAVQTIDERTVVFVETDGGFVTQPISLGRSNETHVEVLHGLSPGQHYVVDGSFECKAKIVTSGLGAHAGHGH